jgi:alkylated DNA repair protein (DNA oxidative demethylase)
MSRRADTASAELFARDPIETIVPGALALRGFATAETKGLLQAIERIAAAAPFRNMETPGGFRMSVAMTNCGAAGWITDRRGYRYAALDPLSGQPWPAMPALFSDLAARAAVAAGFADFMPDACLVNRYEPGARMSLHQDKNERDAAQPIVSISLGLPATFLFGGLKRSDRPQRLRLESGDVVVWGGAARMAFHGIDPLPAAKVSAAKDAAGADDRLGSCRFNLTLRKAL